MQKKIYIIALLGLFLSSVANAENWFYTFQKGDTVWDVSHNSLVDWQHWDDIVKLNKITKDHRMKPGTKIAIPIKWLKQRESKISVRKVSGQVRVQLAQSKRSLALKPGMRIALGDSVQTGKDSIVQLVFEDGTKLTLLEQSQLIMVTARIVGGERMNASDIKARISKGRVNIHANPDKQPDNRFEILTVAGNSAVRGTQFRVNANPISTKTEVLSGKIQVSNPQGRINLPTGFGTVAQVGKKPLPPIALLKAPSIDHLPRVVRYLPMTVKLANKTKQANIASYRVQVAKQSEPELIIIDRIVKENLFINQNLLDMDYLVKIRAIDKQGLEGKTAQFTMQIDARPEAPFQQQPEDEQVQPAGKIYFKWSEPEDIAHYLLEISTKKEFLNDSVTQYELTENQYIETINELGNYYWRISSIEDTGKIGPPSNVSTLIIVPKPEQPKLEKAAIDENKLTLKWRDSGPDVYYEVQFSSDPSFTQIISEERVSQAQFTIVRPSSGSYYFRAKTISNDNFSSPYSPVQKINVPPKSYWPAGIASFLVLLLVL